ncbi:DUF2064 domain-containing protein [Haloparvum sp. PAK95]|uniref:DUF2064 domain-containing protein n=1 Tax=Haloparvum sp. PAK95 TaxID=3418962 RepID=UPI003D2F3EE8
MTVVAVLADPPREGHALSALAETSPLSAAEAAELSEAALRDTVLAVARSGSDLLVNYPTDDQLPDAAVTDTPAAAELRAIVGDTLDSLDDVRFEKQVGSSFDARVGNTVTHLLREEGERSVAVVRPNAPFLTRTLLDGASMQLRSNEAVLGPSTAGRTYYAGFTEPIDFDGAFASPPLETLTARTRDVDGDVEFLETQPTIATGADLLDVVPEIRARVAAERNVPVHTAEVVHDLGLDVVEEDGEPTLVRE